MFGKTKTFNPDTDIPDLAGKVILITGGNAGLGKETARQLAKHNPREIIIATRTAKKAHDAIDDIKRETPSANLTFLELDLSSLESVKRAAEEFESTHSAPDTKRLDILINNAGVMAVPYSETKEGFEIQLGTCHVGHALLTSLLLPTLHATALKDSSDVRILNLSSEGHNFSTFSKGVIYQNAESYRTEIRYGSAKLANILHARALRDKVPSITSAALHPGVIPDTALFDATRTTAATSLLYRVVYKIATAFGTSDVHQGAHNTLWCATAPQDLVRKGYYFKPVGVMASGNGNAQNKNMADDLWTWTSEKLVEKGFGPLYVPPLPDK